MGITLHAQVEYYAEANEWRAKGGWSSISRWELGKDHELMELIRESCHALHPKGDDAPDFDEEDFDCFDQGRHWIEAGLFPFHATKNDHWASLEASLIVLIGRGRRYRVLFWEM